MKGEKLKRKRSGLSSLTFLGALKPKIQKAKNSLENNLTGTQRFESQLIGNLSD